MQKNQGPFVTTDVLVESLFRMSRVGKILVLKDSGNRMSIVFNFTLKSYLLSVNFASMVYLQVINMLKIKAVQ